MKLKSLLSISIPTLFLISCSTHQKNSVLIARTSKARPTIAISTSEPLVAKVAEEIFQKGGNIIDVAIASSFAVSVVRPQSTGIGGGGFLVYFDGKSKSSRTLDFRETAPSRIKREMFLKDGEVIEDLSSKGGLSVGVPGFVSGMHSLYKMGAKLSWKELLAPSIRLARSPITVSAHLAHKIELEKESIEQSEELKNLFYKNGRALRAGETFSNFALADTIQNIADHGAEYFYKGEFAKQLSDYIQANGGVLSQKDLSQYHSKFRMPLQAKWRNYKIITMPPPSSGGLHLVQILKLVDKIPETFRQYFNESAHYKSLGGKVAEIESMKRVFVDRAFLLGDPDFVNVPSQTLISDHYLRRRRKEIIDRHILPSVQIRPYTSLKVDRETTHISLMDSEGTAISTTQSVNHYFGSKMIVPKTGVILNNTIDDFAVAPGKPNGFGLIGGEKNKIEANKRPLSSMTPTIVLDNNNAILAIGAPGGSRIITGVYHVLSRILRDDLAPEDAIRSCRFHHQWMPDILTVEPECRADFKYLEKFYKIETAKTSFFGEVQVVGRENNGDLFSVIDPRGSGKPAVFNAPQQP